ncbi:hydrogen peroxide-dependent heme synthase [Curtobacterium sp. Leaf261]|uniref:hydrogen peroxide-dependent heme synthase n=1 Tax=Curtobacterium sp. Leaf261 TaxID=1736311 RepID=UPI0006F3BD53|nr:hydrogen peroxide-dependent heme synthase [Curtobacterium sp. Leaf261]KQO63806.1 chlorite dismutase [Curtobacterium sp. Leaf261]
MSTAVPAPSSSEHTPTHHSTTAGHGSDAASSIDPASGIDPNLMTAFALWAVFRRPVGSVAEAGPDAVAELDAAVSAGAEQGVTVRGFYDVSGFRADADVMIWLHGDDAQTIQSVLRRIRRTVLFADAEPVWHVMAMHREAEFNKRHTPAFLRGKDPEAWITVYPFVRSYEWYLLPEDERSTMLRDHGINGAKYRRVLTNTIATFALSDYEWILPLESPELVDLVDLMRDLRATEARLHVREEVPFYTGRRVTTAELPEVLA